jgi:hypothetical protein
MNGEAAALTLAGRIRAGDAPLEPARLYELAGNGEGYRHAMIHAGAVGPKGPGSFRPYDPCPVCGKRWSRHPAFAPSSVSTTKEERE